jgi:hypothetical protein
MSSQPYIADDVKAAIARLRAYKPPPFKAWDKLPLSRRAAVLVLLFADRHGDLRVVLTMRASTLRNYSGTTSDPFECIALINHRASCLSRRESRHLRRNSLRNSPSRSLRRNRTPPRRLQIPQALPNRTSLPASLLSRPHSARCPTLRSISPCRCEACSVGRGNHDTPLRRQRSSSSVLSTIP